MTTQETRPAPAIGKEIEWGKLLETSRLTFSSEASQYPLDMIRQRKYYGPCKVENCERGKHAHGYCSMHWQRIKRCGGLELPERMYQTDCSVAGCKRKAATSNLCNPHAHRLRRYGDPTYHPGTDLSVVDTSLYGVWAAMKARCYNPNVASYQNYGARGIGVCAFWRTSYVNFINDMGTRPDGMTLDRRNNNDGYHCGKCQDCRSNGWSSNVEWATRTEQARNTRRSHYLTHDGRTLTVAEWTIERGLGRGTIWDRLDRGWSVDDAINTPIQGRAIQHRAMRDARPPRQTSSIFLGVNLAIHTRKWRATVTKDDKQFHVGLFDSEDEAAWMRDQWAAQIIGNGVKLNFEYLDVSV